VTSSTATTGSSRLARRPGRALAAARDAFVELPWTAQLVGALLAATVVARSPGLLFNGLFDRDEAYLAVMGDVLRHGGTLYVDVIDRKPPLVPYAYGLARELSVDMRTVRVLCALAVLVNGLLVAGLARRLSGRRRGAVAAGLLAVLGTSWFLPADAQAANFELWALAPATGAVWVAVSGRGRRQSWTRFAVAGALVALAAHTKQPFVVVGLPVAVEALRTRDRGRRVASAAAGAAGAVAASLPLALVVDPGRLWRWVWLDNGDYLDGGLSVGRALGVGIGLTVVFLCFHVPLLYGFWAAVTRRVRLDATVVVWTVASLATVPLGLRFFGHYYQQLVPPLAVLSGVALATAGRWAWRLVGAAAVITTVVLVTLSFALRPDLSDFTALGRYVQRTTSPDDEILVWGALPDVYVSAQRDPSGVFLHGGYLTGNWASRAEVLDASVIEDEPYRERWRVFLADLAADPPELVVDAARPGTDWAGYAPERYPLGSLLARCYDEVGRVDGLPVWRRDHAACPA
jgi:hypothetical protein